MSDVDSPSTRSWGMTMRQRRQALLALVSLLDRECAAGHMWIAETNLLAVCLDALAEADGQHFHRHHRRAHRLRQDVMDTYAQVGYAQIKGQYFVDGLLDVARQLQAECVAARPYGAS